MSLPDRLARARLRIDAGCATRRDEALVVVSMLIGGFAGFLAAELVARSLPLASRGVEAARAAGIVSATVRAGYPKDVELVFLAIGLAFTGAAALLAGVAAAWWRGAGRPRRAAARETSPLVRFGIFEGLVVVAVFLLGAQPAPLLKFGAPWRILFEEGTDLLPAIVPHLGGRIHQDAHYMYGPLLVLPLVGSFSLVTPSVFAARVTALGLHGLGLALAALAARRLFRSRLAWLGCAAALPVFVPLLQPRINMCALRSTVALLPLLALPAALRGGPGALVAVGGATSVALATSPEVGAVALLAYAAVIAMSPIRGGRMRGLGLFAAGLVSGMAILWVSLQPVVDFAQYGRDALATLTATPVGYLSRPFPVPWGADRLWRGDPYAVGLDPERSLPKAGAVLTLLVVTGVVLGFRAVRQPLRSRDWLGVASWLLALGLLPKLVNRPGPHSFAGVLAPLVLVVAYTAEVSILSARRRRAGRLLPLLLPLGLLAVAYPLAVPRPPRLPPRLPELDHRLGPIPVDPQFARLVREVRAEVNARLPRAERLWVTPTTMGWHMLLDRLPAVRQPAVATLPTAADREALVRELREDPPRLLLRHRARDQVDGIPVDDYGPEIAAFVATRYRRDGVVQVGRYRVELLVPRREPEPR